MKAIHKGSLREDEKELPDIKKDMKELRETAENMVSWWKFSVKNISMA